MPNKAIPAPPETRSPTHRYLAVISTQMDTCRFKSIK